MIDIPSRESLAALTEAANAIVPSVILGFARSLDDARVSVLYRYPYGIAQYVIPVSDRIADRLAVTLARDPGIEASRRADEATTRASQLEARVRALTEELDARTGYRRVIGESTEWRQVLTQATQVASTEATVLLLGESGTGKVQAAKALGLTRHQLYIRMRKYGFE